MCLQLGPLDPDGGPVAVDPGDGQPGRQFQHILQNLFIQLQMGQLTLPFQRAQVDFVWGKILREPGQMLQDLLLNDPGHAVAAARVECRQAGCPGLLSCGKEASSHLAAVRAPTAVATAAAMALCRPCRSARSSTIAPKASLSL